jgi:hypothetical protein
MILRMAFIIIPKIISKLRIIKVIVGKLNNTEEVRWRMNLAL